MKNKLYAVINMIGLAVGLTIYLLSTLVAEYERNHDNMFTNHSRIFTVSTVYAPGANSSTLETRGVYTAMQPLIELQIPELEGAARSMRQEVLVQSSDKQFYQEVRFVDPAFSHMFDFDYIHGQADRISAPNEIAVTDTFARKFFGRTDVVGETLTLNHQEDVRVVAVFREVPANSHFNSAIGEAEHLEAFAPMQLFERLVPDYRLAENWFNLSSDNMLYLMTDGTFEPEALEAAVDAVYKANAPADAQESNVGQHVRPLKEANLAFWHNSGIPFIAIVEFMGVLVLMVAMINFANLATAQNIGRTREVGLRKTLGASRSQILQQFLLESQCITMMAMILAVVVLEAIVPMFNTALGKNLTLDYVAVLPWLVGVTIIVGLIAGSYPAYMIVRAKPVEALRNENGQGRKGQMFRSIMIGTQFALSIIMLAMVFVIYGQNNRVVNASDVFPKSQIIDLRRIEAEEIGPRRDRLMREIMAVDGVEMAAYSSQVPFLQQNWRWDVTGQKGDMAAKFEINTVNVGLGFLKTYDIPIVAGRDFSPEISADIVKPDSGFSHVIINELLVRKLGFATPDEALGQVFYSANEGDNPHQLVIVGVMENRNILGLHNQMRPFAMRMSERYRHLSVRISGDNIFKTIEGIESAWARVVPEYPVDWVFLDAVFDQYFQVLRAVNQIVAGFALIAVLLALFGLFGLAAYMAERRTKEIGIRKVLGADIMRIVTMLVLQFSKPVFGAMLLALPVAYLVADKYLSLFADRIGMPLTLVLLAGLMALLFSWATISLHAVRVARTNPIKALRYE